MTEVRAQHALAPEPDLVSDTLRRVVVGVGYELESLQVELVERVP
jgi:hypothetical protein